MPPILNIKSKYNNFEDKEYKIKDKSKKTKVKTSLHKDMRAFPSSEGRGVGFWD